jgi:hypothetical protein
VTGESASSGTRVAEERKLRGLASRDLRKEHAEDTRGAELSVC